MTTSAAVIRPRVGSAAASGRIDLARAGGLLAAITAVLIRLPFLHAPVAADEGGIAAIARWWAQGGRLYRDLFLDRPQLLILVFRFADWLAPSNAAGIRLVAIAFGMATAWLVTRLVASLTGDPLAAAAAGLAYAVIGSSPAMEAFSLYGELAVGTPTMAALVLFARWWRTVRDGSASRARPGLLAGAGACGAAALLMKQSGIDALGVMISALIFLALPRHDPSAQRAARRGLAWLVLGAALPIGASVAHGFSVGIGAYWDAMAGYRLRYVSAVDGDLGDRVARLTSATARLAPLLVVLGGLALLGAWSARPRVRLLLVAWFVWAVAGFLSGGLFWLHYFMGPALPLCCLAGLGVARLVRTLAGGLSMRALVAAAAVTLACTLVGSQTLTALRAGARRDGGEELLEMNHRHHVAAAYLREHSEPDDRFQALWQSGAMAWLADRRPADRFLWATWFAVYPGAVDTLAAELDADDRPLYVVELQDVGIVNPIGRPQAIARLRAVLAARYRWEATVDGVRFLRRADR